MKINTLLLLCCFSCGLLAQNSNINTGSNTQATTIPLHWVVTTPTEMSLPLQGMAWGVPFDRGEVSATDKSLLTISGEAIPSDFSPLAYWPDGSVKWGGFYAAVPVNVQTSEVQLQMLSGKAAKRQEKWMPSTDMPVQENARQIVVHTDKAVFYFSKKGHSLLDSIRMNDQLICGAVRLLAQTEQEKIEGMQDVIRRSHYQSVVEQAMVEQRNAVRTVIKIEGRHSDGQREWLPFVVRCYLYKHTEQMKMVHTFIYDGDPAMDNIAALGLSLSVPMREALYNRHVAFSTADGGVWAEPVQPLVGRTKFYAKGDMQRPAIEQRQMEAQRIPEYDGFDERNQSLIRQLASWGDYRLSQVSDKAFTIRKRTQSPSPWIGTFSSTRAGGSCFVGDISGGMAVGLLDFWQSYPSSLEISHARAEVADMTIWLWSPEAEAMNLRHYDTIPHGLEASYEDVQEGLSTPYGIARTHTLQLLPTLGYQGKSHFAECSKVLTQESQWLCTPSYLHEKRAFGVWSLPDTTSVLKAQVEARLQTYLDYYQKMVEEHSWYGFWNYGDVMHSYDVVRHEWMYDVGGYAWDNTELASNMWLWYSFLRTGDADIWRMAVAMTRHTGEVDVYHLGDLAGLGSRHNISHWGCGAKEARISQAAWNRFYYYLTADERCGDLMHEVKDVDQKLYTLDPMRLAQPREQYPCTAPARLRIGPDWLAYAGNWMTEWERTGNTLYRDKIVAGMKSIAALPHGIFTGPKALGYDPATGIITCESDTSVQNTNHLLPIMGGFEIMNEMMSMISLPEWEHTWLDFCAQYHEKAENLTHNHFQIPRLPAYAAYKLQDESQRQDAWRRLLGREYGSGIKPLTENSLYPPEVPSYRVEIPKVGTNSVATWSLDAIYLLEVCPE